MKKVVSWLNENQCPECYSRMLCYENELSLYNVDDDGNIEPLFDNFDSFYSCVLYCPQCNKEFSASINNGHITRTKYIMHSIKKKNPFYGG